MTDEAKEAAKKLFDKLNRDEKGVVVTVGVGRSAIGNEVLIPYYVKDPTIVPNRFEGFPVFPSSARDVRVMDNADA